jgi:twitching motility protein PilT
MTSTTNQVGPSWPHPDPHVTALSPEQLTQAAHASGFVVIDDPKHPVDPAAARLVPPDLPAVGLAVAGDVLSVAVGHLPSPADFRALEKATGMAVTVAVAIEPAWSALRETAAGSDAAPRNVGPALVNAVERNASDVHLSVGSPPVLRVNGSLIPLENWPALSALDLERTARWVAGDEFAAGGDVDCSVTYAGARWRVSLYRQRQSLALAMRRIPGTPPRIEELGLPAPITRFGQLTSGLVLFCGPTGSGKSTSLAALVDRVNRTRSCHIMTLEDPVEYVHSSAMAMVHQREVGVDVADFASGLRSALRQDPDVLLVGELRDLETISTALSAAETGHLVFGTVHASTAAGAISRVVDAFPANQQGQIRSQLAASLQGVVAQKLLPGNDRRQLATEILIATTAVRNMIRENKLHEIGSVLDNNLEMGMTSMDRSLAALFAAGKISRATAVEHVTDENNFEQYLRRVNGNGQDRLDPLDPLDPLNHGTI